MITNNPNTKKARLQLRDASKAARKACNVKGVDAHVANAVADVYYYAIKADGFEGALRYVYEAREEAYCWQAESAQNDIDLLQFDSALDAVDELVDLGEQIAAELGISLEDVVDIHDGTPPVRPPSKQRKAASECDFSREHLAVEREEVEEVVEKPEPKQYADIPLDKEERTSRDNAVIAAIIKEANTGMAQPGLFADISGTHPFGHIWLRRTDKGRYLVSASAGAFESKSQYTTVAVINATRGMSCPGFDADARADHASVFANRVIEKYNR